ncbi:hypothetical protein BH10PSE1_BH10PSE1_13010 [soil metagenome]
MPDLDHPEGAGVWTRLQSRSDHTLWQQDEPDGVGGVVSRFWIVNPPEELMYDTFDEAEAMFEALGGD